MSSALKNRVVWLLLALTLYQAWAAVRHVHAFEEAAHRQAAVMGQDKPTAGVDLVRQTVAASEPDVPAEDAAGDTHCDCLWCAPRLHMMMAYALPVPEPPADIHPPQRLAAALRFHFPPNPRGTVPPPRGPPA